LPFLPPEKPAISWRYAICIAIFTAVQPNYGLNAAQFANKYRRRGALLLLTIYKRLILVQDALQ